ncbi:MAG TPA: hypothetical protein PK413_16990, partial [Thermoanaerobaculia bacterium]|nr:hypothetical protein [Thermoanaerobaculia bacterium]
GGSMRKLLPVVFVALAIGISFSGSLSALTASEEAFLQSLGTSGTQLGNDSAPGVGVPEPSLRSCSISRACGDGNTVSCTGTFSCVFSWRGVSCNGNEVPCPNYCSMGWRCSECPLYVFSCFSLKGDCGVSASGCDGNDQECSCPDVQN